MDFIISKKEYEEFQDVEDFIQYNLFKRNEVVYIFEFNHIYTYGKSIESLNVPNCIDNIKTIKSERGGLWTYHGPGQIICYFVLNIRDRFQKMNMDFDINFFISVIEDIIIESLFEIGIKSFRFKEEGRGVWVNFKNQNMKIASIGLKVSSGFLHYGFSINYSNDLEPFKKIKVCDIKTKITSVSEVLNAKILNKEEFKKIILEKNKIKFTNDLCC